MAQHDDLPRDEPGDGAPGDRSVADGLRADGLRDGGLRGDGLGATRREIRRAVVITVVAFLAIIISSLLFVLAGTAR